MNITNQNQIEQYRKLHDRELDYGKSGVMFCREIELFIKEFKPATVLDYGCGKGRLVDYLQRRFPKIRFYKYDPSIAEYATVPVSHVDMVINTDVLEHIPENDIDDVLKHIESLCDYAYFNLHHAVAVAILPNGENAHCTIKDSRWYLKKMKSIFGKITGLPGRQVYTSVAITQDVPPELIRKYKLVIAQEMVIDAMKQTAKNLLGLLALYIRVGK